MGQNETPPQLDVRILYVEDDLVTRQGLEEYLSLRVKEVIVASNGEEGLQLFHSFQPDIVITDVKMPVMNGIEMVKRIKALNRDIPVIVTTAYNDVEILLESIDMGINQYLLKPVIGQKLMTAIQKCMRSITLEQELVQIAGLLSEYKNAIDSSSLVLKCSTECKITYVNDALCNLSGYGRGELIGEDYTVLLSHEASNLELFEEMRKYIQEKRNWKGVWKEIKKNGEPYYLHVTIVPISGTNQTVSEFMTIAYEVTELIRKEQLLLRQLYFDTPTGLPNRTKLLEDVEKTDHPLLSLINVDSFQEINDFYGNEIGDYILSEIGHRLAALLPSSDYTLYKMPADEYAILKDREKTVEHFLPILTRIQEEINEKPFVYKDNSIHINVACGVALGDDTDTMRDKDKWHHLALNADMALKKAKQLKKHYIVFEESMQISKEYENNIKWTHKLKEAIKDNRIIPFFQPILNNHTGAIEKYECLVRMIDHDGSIYSPILFLDLAKKTRLYPHLTKIMLSKSLDMFKNQDFGFSINLSVDDMLDEETRFYISRLLKENHKTAPRIVFEILESEGIENYDEVSSFIQEVKDYGCKVAVDDFGTGYSNFSHILRLNIDYLKIDASLTKQILERNTQFVVQTIIDFSQKLGISTIAEFVYNRGVYEKLLEMGVDYSQGFYFGEPKITLS